MIYLDCDYMCGAHPEVLDALIKSNGEQTAGYGFDHHTANARRLILEACGAGDSADVFLLVGGTQTNSTVIDALLRSYQGVVAAETGHINVHEAGAIETNGHKVLTIPQHDGKILASDLHNYLSLFFADETWPHMVSPGLVYITFASELGTLYSLAELEAIKEVCLEFDLPLFLDGARLGYGLAAEGCDVTLEDIYRICDVFYIGGTKAGLMMGEAVVAHKGVLPNFFSIMKQHGAVLAKGRMLGVQFETLFTDDLYLRISRHADRMAVRLKEGFIRKGYKPIVDSPTNQQFFTLPNEVIDHLLAIASFEYWGPRGERESTVRFVTSWPTTEAEIDTLLSYL